MYFSSSFGILKNSSLKTQQNAIMKGVRAKVLFKEI